MDYAGVNIAMAGNSQEWTISRTSTGGHQLHSHNHSAHKTWWASLHELLTSQFHWSISNFCWYGWISAWRLANFTFSGTSFHITQLHLIDLQIHRSSNHTLISLVRLASIYKDNMKTVEDQCRKYRNLKQHLSQSDMLLLWYRIVSWSFNKLQ